MSPATPDYIKGTAVRGRTDTAPIRAELLAKIDALLEECQRMRDRLNGVDNTPRARCAMSTRLERVEPLASGGTVAYRVIVDGRWVGWVGDMRPWRGWRYGGRQWWACWREEGDTAARWNSSDDHPHRTRAAALAELVERVTVRQSDGQAPGDGR